MRCAVTGMSASIAFQPDGIVSGAASRLQGQGTAKIAAIDGRRTDIVEVTAPEWEARGEILCSCCLRFSKCASAWKQCAHDGACLCLSTVATWLQAMVQQHTDSNCRRPV